MAANGSNLRHSHSASYPVLLGLTCEEVLSKCDAVLAAKNKQIEKLELGLAAQTGRVADLSNQLEDKNSQLQSPFRNPFVMTAVGVVIGILVTGYALKQ